MWKSEPNSQVGAYRWERWCKRQLRAELRALYVFHDNDDNDDNCPSDIFSVRCRNTTALLRRP